jgi:peptide/nickel transport system permease protein
MMRRCWGRGWVRLSLGWLGLVLASALLADLVSLPRLAERADRNLGELLAYLVHGCRTTVLFALGVIVVAVPLGTALGGLAGTGSRIAEFVLARGVELAGVWPSVVLVALVRLVLPQGNTMGLVLLLGGLRCLHLGRLVRSETLRLAMSDFAWAARALGADGLRLFRRQLWPHLGGLVLAQTALSAAWVVALEAGLTMAGLGIAQDSASWGHLLGRAHDLGPLRVSLPAVAVVLTSLACGVLADAIDDARAPRRGPAAAPATPLRGELPR